MLATWTYLARFRFRSTLRKIRNANIHKFSFLLLFASFVINRHVNIYTTFFIDFLSVPAGILSGFSRLRSRGCPEPPYIFGVKAVATMPAVFIGRGWIRSTGENWVAPQFIPANPRDLVAGARRLVFGSDQKPEPTIVLNFRLPHRQLHPGACCRPPVRT